MQPKMIYVDPPCPSRFSPSPIPPSQDWHLLIRSTDFSTSKPDQSFNIEEIAKAQKTNLKSFSPPIRIDRKEPSLSCRNFNDFIIASLLSLLKSSPQIANVHNAV